MHNPLLLFSKDQLDAFMKAGKTHFVRQTYSRGLNPHDTSIKAAFLITHYDDAQKAWVHYDAIASDPNRFLYESSNPTHVDKLKVAASQPAGFAIYAALLQEAWRPPQRVAEQIRRYIEYRLHWKPGRNDNVSTNLFLQFGTLFITLKFKDTETKVPFSDIETG